MRSLAHVKQFHDVRLLHVIGVSQALLCRLQHLLGVSRWSHLRTHSSSGYYVTGLKACFLSLHSAVMRHQIKHDWNVYNERHTRAANCPLEAAGYDTYAHTKPVVSSPHNPLAPSNHCTRIKETSNCTDWTSADFKVGSE